MQESGGIRHEFGKMKKLKKIFFSVNQEQEKEFKDSFRKNLPHLTFVEDGSMISPANPYAKFSRDSGFWEIRSKPVSLFPNRF